MKILDAKAAVDKECDNLTNLPALQESRVKSEQVVIEQAQIEGRAKVLGVITRLPGCAGQASDAVSANVQTTQVKMKDVPKLLRIPESQCPTIWIRLPLS